MTPYRKFLQAPSLVLLLILFSLYLTGCSGVGAKVLTPAAPPQATLQSSVPAITSGQSATLSWTSANATGITITPAVGSGALPLNGSVTVTPTATTTYALTASGSGGTTASASVTVTVNAPPPPPPPPPPPAAPTVTLAATPAAINSGQPSSLVWTSANATSVTISPSVLSDELNALPLSGSTAIIPTATTTYTITATGSGGTATASATITVTQVPPTVTLTLTPAQVLSGKPAVLSWSSVNAATLTITGSPAANPLITVTTPQQGSVTVMPTATTVYTATATSPGGLTATATATLTVSNLSVTLAASPASITPGLSSTLTFTSMNAVSLSIDHGVPAINPPNGTVTVSPTVTTVYTITATDASGLTSTATATVSVNNGMQTLQHILFFVQENRSFDNYFGKLGVYRANDPLTGQSYGAVTDIDGTPVDSQYFNLDPNGKKVFLFHQPSPCIDVVSPSWDESHVDVNKQPNGTYLMDGFVKTGSQGGGQGGQINDPLGHRAMGYYDQRDLPYYYELATQYATSDRWFAPELANTIPNRMYLFTGTSYGTTYPEVPTQGAYLQKTIFQALSEAGISWRYYYQDNASFLGSYITAAQDKTLKPPSGPLDYLFNNIRDISEYYDILAGRVPPSGDTSLASVVFIERGSGSANTDEHPDSGKNVQFGAAAAANIINSFIASPYYATSAFILTYDEPGALFDHVPPQPATAPDAQPPSLQSPDGGKTGVIPGDFLSTSMRLPFILISPYAKPHFVSHTVRDNTAILKFIEDRFLPGTSLTARDAAQADMLEFFDFSNPALLVPPKLPVQPSPTTPSGGCQENLEAGP